MSAKVSRSLRPPVVAVMGHVDHGKTTLLDYIRHTNVVAREHGGITQHLGAYQVRLDDGRIITFLDTPGHAAFETIRRRGGEVADIVVLVVAADDGVMPQTVEAIKHIKNSGCTMIVAINKIDLPDADVDRVKQQLAEHDVLVESYGGDVVSVEISAKTGQGVIHLLEMIGLVSELLELESDFTSPVVAFCLESRLDKAGPLASFLVKRGTLKQGMSVSIDGVSGKIKALRNAFGEVVKSAVPSEPVEVIGLPRVPEAGVVFIEENGVLSASNSVGILAVRHVSLQTFDAQDVFAFVGKEEHYKVVIKADTVGSLEAVRSHLPYQDKVLIVSHGLGDISEADILTASASRAVIYGFNVSMSGSARRLAQEERVIVKEYKIIYSFFDDFARDVVAYFTHPPTETVSGRAEVLKLFSRSSGTLIAGIKVTEGVIAVGSSVRVVRNGVEVGRGKVATAKKFKEDVLRLSAGHEGGITFDSDLDVQEKDVIESYKIIAKS